MFSLLSRSKSVRGNSRASSAASSTNSSSSSSSTDAGSMRGPGSTSSMSTVSTSTAVVSPPSSAASATPIHVKLAHGPNAPLSLLSTMVMAPGASTMSAMGAGMMISSTSSSSSSTTSSTATMHPSTSVHASTNTANTTTSTSTATHNSPGRVSGPTLQTSTVLGLVENKRPSPPSPGLDGRRECPYINRPLPPPPPPKSDISSSSMSSLPSSTPFSMSSARPGTSAGTAAISSRMLFDHRMSRDDMFLGAPAKSSYPAGFGKRISRDDLYLGSNYTYGSNSYTYDTGNAYDTSTSNYTYDTSNTGSTGNTTYNGYRSYNNFGSFNFGNNSGPRATKTSFHVPLARGQLPTPDESPRILAQASIGASLTQQQQLTSGIAPGTAPAPADAASVRMATPESLTSGEIQIGMALGSPAHPPVAMQPHQQQQQKEVFVPPAAWRTQTQPQPQEPAASSSLLDANTPPMGPMTTTATSNGSSEPLQRSKTTRRKLFGIFSGKRHQESAASSSFTDGSSASSASFSATSTSASTASSSSSVDQRPPTRSGTNKKYQPIVITAMDTTPAATTSAAAGAMSTAVSSGTDDPLPPMTTGVASVTKEARSMRPFLRSKASEPALRTTASSTNGSSLAMMQSQSQSQSQSQLLTSLPVAAGPPPPIPSSTTASPFLDVVIPDVRLERYSVMFGSVLHIPSASAGIAAAAATAGSSAAMHEGQSTIRQPASSLLARRQATLDRLKTINDRLLQEDLERERAAAEAADAALLLPTGPAGRANLTTTLTTASTGLQRRATSPMATRSPAFSLFPGKSPSPLMRSPRLRASTSPAPLAPLPASSQQPATSSQQQIQRKPPPRFINPLRENPTNATMARRDWEVTAPPPRRAATMTDATTTVTATAQHNARFDPAQSSLLLDSPTEMDDEGWVVQQQQQQQQRANTNPLKPVLAEPQWQMVTPMSTQSSKQNQTPMDDGGGELALQSAVEISIARQISISQQQRQRLRPLQTTIKAPSATNSNAKADAQTLSATMSSRSESPARPMRLGRNERLQEIKAATPTLVLPEQQMQQQAQERQWQQQQQQYYQAPRTLQPAANNVSNSNTNNLYVYQMTQNRRSERVVLEAA